MSRSSHEEERKLAASVQQQQRLILAERQRLEARQQAYYGSAPASTQPSAVSAVSLNISALTNGSRNCYDELY